MDWFIPTLTSATVYIPKFQPTKSTNYSESKNHAARVVMNASYEQPSAELLKELHWLPVKARVMFKVLVIVFRVINGTAPVYLREMFVPTRQRYRLRSQSDTNFNIPRRRTKLADRSMAVVGPKWWNDLPSYLKNIQSEASFRSKLKTHLFRQFYEQRV